MLGPKLKLPAVVFLPPATLLDSRTVSESLGGVSRQLLSLWRRRHAFPLSVRPAGGHQRFTRAAELAAWLVAKNIRVEWI